MQNNNNLNVFDFIDNLRPSTLAEIIHAVRESNMNEEQKEAQAEHLEDVLVDMTGEEDAERYLRDAKF